MTSLPSVDGSNKTLVLCTSSADSVNTERNYAIWQLPEPVRNDDGADLCVIQCTQLTYKNALSNVVAGKNKLKFLTVYHPVIGGLPGTTQSFQVTRSIPPGNYSKASLVQYIQRNCSRDALL